VRLAARAPRGATSCAGVGRISSWGGHGGSAVYGRARAALLPWTSRSTEVRSDARRHARSFPQLGGHRGTPAGAGP
jgi:hypothetical protein